MFLIGSTINVSSGIHIRGDGPDSTFVMRSLANPHPLFRIPAGQKSVTISDFTLDGQLAEGALADVAQIEVGNSLTNTPVNTRLQRIHFTNFDHMGVADSGDTTSISDCRFKGTVSITDETRSSIWGVWQGSVAKNLSVSHCDFRTLWGSAMLAYGDDGRFCNNTVENTHMAHQPGPWWSGGQVAIGQTVNDTAYSWIISNNTILSGGGAGTSGIELHCVDAVVTGNIVYNQAESGIASQGSGRVERTISSNIIKGCNTGVSISNGSQQVNLVGNDCHNNGTGVWIGVGCIGLVLCGNRSQFNASNLVNASPSNTASGNLW